MRPPAMMEDLAPKGGWVPHRPEERLSIAFDRFLDRALVHPCYYTAIQDSDGGARSDMQRIRDRVRGRKKGQLDWEVHQGPPYLTRKVELKRGSNTTSSSQDDTIRALKACGAPPIVAWSLREAHSGLLAAGFRFHPNVLTTLQHCEALLEAWDREAEITKRTPRKKAAPRKAGPRFVGFKRARAGGLL